jgi:MoaA/NifB/PqqE/SkfB family radical SAM enzyme
MPQEVPVPVSQEENRNALSPQTGTPAFRLDVPIHQLLMSSEQRTRLEPQAKTLPEPVYPRRHYPDSDQEAVLKKYRYINTTRGLRAWAAPFFKSLWFRDELRPIIAYLFTDYACNLDCHYCWSYDNRVKGMTEDTARRSIDWLHSIGNRVLALMGGEPLLRPKFIHKVVDYAAQKGFFVYLPTNGRLMKPEVIDWLGDAGLATVNLAVDSVKERKALPKALEPIRPQFDYLVKNRHKYGYTVMLNINITRINLRDVRELTQIARDCGIYSDYHVNEPPITQQGHFKHLDENDTYLRPENYAEVDELIDWLVELNRQGHKMPNPRQHLAAMKEIMRGRVEPWSCRAGHNTLIIRTDGTLAPCFPMYSAKYDWGVVENHRFERSQLSEMKKSCNPHCLSTCNYLLSHCYDTRRAVNWVLKQARSGFREPSGSFE